jgi:hypothetical protein
LKIVFLKMAKLLQVFLNLLTIKILGLTFRNLLAQIQNAILTKLAIN